MFGRLVIGLIVALGSCSAVPITNSESEKRLPSTPIRWQADLGCMQTHSVDPGGSRNSLATDCHDTGKRQRDFVAIALSGGGAKAAVFSGETLFYMQALGLLQVTSVISTVSGGSVAGAVYALSCDPTETSPNSNNAMCAGGRTRGLDRPIWNLTPS
jgi:hypothetical protein